MQPPKRRTIELTRAGKILNTPHLECPERELIRSALDLYATKNIDFINAYHAFLLKAQGISRIATYDRKHFRRVQGLDAEWVRLRAEKEGYDVADEWVMAGGLAKKLELEETR